MSGACCLNYNVVKKIIFGILDGILLTNDNVQDRHRPDQPTYRGLPRLAPAPRPQAARAPGVPRHGRPVRVADGQQEEVLLTFRHVGGSKLLYCLCLGTSLTRPTCTMPAGGWTSRMCSRGLTKAAAHHPS